MCRRIITFIIELKNLTNYLFVKYIFKSILSLNFDEIN